jgi:N-acetylmuramic acid 6-phosphate etherase
MLARNDKLRLRAVRMLRHLTDADEDVIRDALNKAGGSVKVAVLVIKGYERADAEAMLARHGGRLRGVLGEA